MELRWSMRKAIELDVTVKSRGAQMSARCQDLGLEGMYLEVPAHRLQENSPVELVFILGEGRKARTHSVKAFVVRRETDGVGVMFLEFLSQAFRQIEELLYGAEWPGEGRRYGTPPAGLSGRGDGSGHGRRGAARAGSVTT